MSNLSLISIMRDDPEFGKRISKKVVEIKQDKQNLLNVADEYGKKYQGEILEGTERRAKLLTEGKSRGLTEKEIMQEYGRFVPTVYTPLLNLLYFMLRETEDQDRIKYKKRDVLNEALIKAKQLDHDDDEKDLTSEELSALMDETLKGLRDLNTEELLSLLDNTIKDMVENDRRQQINKQFAKEEREDVKLKDTPEMMEYLYGNLTLEDFNKVKKLKALSTSNNIAEATEAFRKGKELCIKFGLDWEKIPCYIKKNKK